MLNNSELSSLDFVINRLFMKLFRTNNIETVEFTQDQFGFDKYYGRDVCVNSTVSSLRRKMPFVS